MLYIASFAYTIGPWCLHTIVIPTSHPSAKTSHLRICYNYTVPHLGKHSFLNVMDFKEPRNALRIKYLLGVQSYGT